MAIYLIPDILLLIIIKWNPRKTQYDFITRIKIANRKLSRNIKLASSIPFIRFGQLESEIIVLTKLNINDAKLNKVRQIQNSVDFDYTTVDRVQNLICLQLPIFMT